jgi:hypothetical protein
MNPLRLFNTLKDCIIQPGELLQTDKRLRKYHSLCTHPG